MNTAAVFPEPAWDVSRLFPAQGQWSEEEYLDLPGNRLVEFDLGHIEVLPTPSESHQLLLIFLHEALSAYVRQHKIGKVLFAPLPMKLWDGKMREPDILFLRTEHYDRRHGNYWQGADLVMEVISPNDPGRDKIIKRREYARAAIPEYWLIDPLEQTVTVLALTEQAEEYATHGIYGLESHASSATLPGFTVAVTELFAAVDDLA
ncbi:MAG: Uma2 family endonuclease [Candidatus Methylumidiphilus sp.]